MRKFLVIQKKAVPLHPQIGSKGGTEAKKIGVWCNGNTADSGPAFPGSSPGTPTEEDFRRGSLFLFPCEIYGSDGRKETGEVIS